MAEGLSARLLVDETATHAYVSRAMLGTLAAAGEDDVVVITFAGHSSPDRNLVLFDTNAADLAGTALSIQNTGASTFGDLHLRADWSRRAGA